MRGKVWLKKEINELNAPRVNNLDLGKSEHKINRSEVFELIDKVDVFQKPIVPEWFDMWYIDMRDEGWSDEHLVTQLSPAIYNTSFKYYNIRNNHFNEAQYDYINDGNFMNLTRAIIDGYEIEQPEFYAKIRGWKLVEDNNKLANTKKVYWTVRSNGDLIQDIKRYKVFDARQKMTAEEWRNLGINSNNAILTED